MSVEFQTKSCYYYKSRERKLTLWIAKESEKKRLAETIDLNSDLLEQNKRLQRELINTKNFERGKAKELYVKRAVKKWRMRSWFEALTFFLLLISVYIIYSGSHNWDLTYLFDKSKSGNWGIIVLFIVGIITLVLTVIFVPTLRDKYKSTTIIDKFEQRLKIPDELQPLPYEE